MNSAFFALFLAAVTALSACGTAGTAPAISNPNNTDPLPAGSGFSAQLFHQFEGEKNPVISPASAALALGLLQPGAAGQTKAELDALLSTCDPEALYAAMSGAEVANSIWFDKSVTPNQTYVNTVKTTYNSEVRTVDLPSTKAMNDINGWVKDKTHGLIPILLNEPLPQGSVAALINALYYKDDWEIPFDANATYDQTFTTAEGETVTVPFMHDTRHNVNYIENDLCRGISLSYASDGGYSMVFLLPKEGYTAAELTNTDFSALLTTASPEYVAISLPKFTLEGTYEMTDALQNMGLKTAFTPAADFSPMGTCSGGPISLSRVLQKTYLRVDEKGTEAAAVTGIIAECTAMPPEEEPIDMTFDAPFLCCLWNGVAEQPLFLARVDDPSGKDA